MLKIVSLCGSHTNFSLRILLDGVPHSYEPATVDGKLNLARVQELDPGLAQADREGLPWQMISAEVATRWPEFLHMVQSAGNALLTKAESEMQLLRRIHTMSTRMEAAGSLEFQKVKKLALASKPPCSARVPHLYTSLLCSFAEAPPHQCWQRARCFFAAAPPAHAVLARTCGKLWRQHPKPGIVACWLMSGTLLSRLP